VADITVTHPFKGRARDPSEWGAYKADTINICRCNKDAKYLAMQLAQNRHFISLVSTTTGAIKADSAILCWAFAQQAAIRHFTNLHWPIHSSSGSELSCFAALPW